MTLNPINNKSNIAQTLFRARMELGINYKGEFTYYSEKKFD